MATKYAESVLAGDLVTCRWVKLACQRYIRDQDRKDIYYDAEAAARVSRYHQHVLKLNGGQFEGRPFVLSDFQEFIAGNNFGWKRLSGFRRFRTSYEEIAKGGGKSPFAAGRAMYLFANDGEARAEVYYAGANKEQAMVAFRDAVAMVDQSPRLSDVIVKSGTNEKVWNMAHLPSGSWCRPISKERRGKSGPRPHGFICDELHEHKTGEILNMLRFGFKWRRQPLGIETTNSGTDKLSICWQHHQYSLKVLKGITEDDEWFAYVCGLDSCEKCYAEGFDQPKEGCKDCDQYDDENVWIKANPNLNVIDQRDAIRAKVREAKEMPEQENETKRLMFCLWTQQVTRYIPMDSWAKCEVNFDIAELKGRTAYPGLDLSSDVDVSALVLVFPPDKLELEKVALPEELKDDRDKEKPSEVFTINVEKLQGTFDLIPFLYLPKDNIAEAARKANAPFELWARQGFLRLTPGNVIDQDYIRDDLLAQRELYPMKDGGFDPWGATALSVYLNNNKGFELVKIPPFFSYITEPTKLFLKLVLSQKLRIQPNPAFRWMVDNFRVIRKGSGVRPAKDSGVEKIDGPTAAIIGLARAMFHAGLRRSVYETRGVLSVGG